MAARRTQPDLPQPGQLTLLDFRSDATKKEALSRDKDVPVRLLQVRTTAPIIKETVISSYDLRTKHNSTLLTYQTHVPTCIPTREEESHV